MINPIALQIGPLAIHWYGISYAVALGVGLYILTYLNKRTPVFKDNAEIFDFGFWIFLVGVIIGGRLGYVLFYNLPYFLQHPAKIPAVWEGGMSFHGGFALSVLVGYLFCKKKKIDFIKLADLAVIPSALALFFTRLANYVNRELVGRVIESPHWQWLGVDFGDGLLRYPSQLFQASSAVIVFLILLYIWNKRPRRGLLLSSYFIFQGLFRLLAEFFRAPDVQVGFILKYFTLGQLFSLGMMTVGIVLFFVFFKRKEVLD